MLSDGLPAKLARKIQKGGYVDMAELLRDNMELGRCREEGPRRAVLDLLTWVTSIVAEKQL